MSKGERRKRGKYKGYNSSRYPKLYDTTALVAHPVIPRAQMQLEDILRNVDQINFIEKLANRPLTQLEIDLIEYMEFSVLTKGMGLTK